MTDRPHEIVLLGATGFTGRLTARWLAETVPDLRWALAGRDVTRLRAIRDELAADRPALADLPILAVDTEDRASVDAMTAATRVVLTTAGPFRRHGPPVVASCVEQGADYADITGEAGFVSAMLAEHHATAADRGRRIVSCCGLDSIPPDLGAWFTVQQLPRQAPIEVRCLMRGNLRTSGGTWNTALEEISRWNPWGRAARTDRPAHDRRVGRLRVGLHRSPEGEWAVPLPTIDGPVVLRSARALDYGPDFRYGHYLGTASNRTVARLAAGVAAAAVGTRIPPVKRWMQARMPPGTGPSMERMLRSWMTATFYATEGDRRVVTRLGTTVDAGYLFTARMAGSAALALARDPLPARFGVITPATAMAEALKVRLEAAGMTFEVLERSA